MLLGNAAQINIGGNWKQIKNENKLWFSKVLARG